MIKLVFVIFFVSSCAESSNRYTNRDSEIIVDIFSKLKDSFSNSSFNDSNSLVPVSDTDFPVSNKLAVSLVPGTVKIGQSTIVAFGVPFPPEILFDVTKIAVFYNDEEIPSYAKETARWRSLLNGPKPNSIRAVIIFTQFTFQDLNPQTVFVKFGETAKQKLSDPGDVRKTWVALTAGVDPDEYPASEGLLEPAVYAGLPKEWLITCYLRNRTTKIFNNAAWKWFDDSLLGFAETAVNDVPPQVTERITVIGNYEPWLFDRAMTLFGVYIRTGDVRWLRHAHRAAQYFANHINVKGYFDLRDADLKYSYNQSLFLDLLLMGDVDHLTKIKQVAAAGSTWDPVYKTSSNFWTERHQTYALLAALSAWEATGEKTYADRIKAVINASFAQAKTPPDPTWPKDGCLLHEFFDHEGYGSKKPVCSPWMSALFADAVWRYYVHSADKGALTFLAGLGEFVQLHAMYLGADGLNQFVPWYLVSSVYEYTDGGPYDDLEHACEVAGLVALGARAQKILGLDPTSLLATVNRLLDACKYNLDNWHRPQGPNSGKAEWRIDPPRKFNWWFGTTLDLELNTIEGG